VREVKEWTVDTWVLYKADDFLRGKEGGLYEAVAFLILVGEAHQVAFDSPPAGRDKGHIASEYERCLQRRQSRFLGEWVKRLRQRKAQVFHSGKLDDRHVQALSTLEFDRSDLPFVAVAFQSKDKLLVSEDSDYTQKVCDYLQQQLQVKVLSLSQALEIARGTQDP
jgi:hypothetical protein